MLGHIRKVLLGNATAQGLQFLATMVLSRIYAPSDFGVLAQVQSIATLAAVVSTLQLHLVIPLSKSDDEARATTESVQTLCIVLGLLGVLPAIFLGPVPTFAMVIAPLLGLANTYNCFLVFKGSFGKLGGFYVVRAILIVTVQIGFAQLSIGSGLLWGVIVGELLSALYLRVTQVGSLRELRFEPRKALALATEKRAFSVFGTLQELIAVAAFYAPLLLFADQFGEDIGGQYAMANRLAWAPVVLLSSSVAQVLYHKLGKSIPPAPGEPLPRIAPSAGVVALVAVGCAVCFLLPELFLLILGDQWGLASQLLPLQLLWGGFFLLATPYRVANRALHLQKVQLAIDLIMLVAIVLLFLLTALPALQTMWLLVALAFLQSVAQVVTAQRGLRRAALQGAPP